MPENESYIVVGPRTGDKGFCCQQEHLRLHPGNKEAIHEVWSHALFEILKLLPEDLLIRFPLFETSDHPHSVRAAHRSGSLPGLIPSKTKRPATQRNRMIGKWKHHIYFPRESFSGSHSKSQCGYSRFLMKI